MKFLTSLLLLASVALPLRATGLLPVDVAREDAMKCLNGGHVVLVETTPAYFLFQAADSTGFVIVSRWKENPQRILGFSEKGQWPAQGMPPQLRQWTDGLKELRPQERVARKRRTQTDGRHDIAPLLTSHWHQDTPFNDLCPVITDGNVRSAAGCVAIAAAQIAYYWRRDNPPALLHDTPVYPYGLAPVTMSIPKGTPNRWELLQDTYDSTSTTSAREAAAQLSYVVGTTSYLNYASSTGGHINDAATALRTQFGLSSQRASKSVYAQEDWETLLYENLKKGYPVLYAGSSPQQGGHAMVIDGYDSKNKLFHFNFGWGGSGDGYYTVDELLGVGGYGQGQACVHDIIPTRRNIVSSMTVKEMRPAEDRVDFTLCLRNQSTIPLTHIYIYITGGQAPSETDTPTICLDETIPNDGSEWQLAFSFPFSLVQEKGHIFLTDENRVLFLSTDMAQITSTLTPLKNQEITGMIYDINGIPRTSTSRSGIYLIPTKSGYKKVIHKP